MSSNPYLLEKALAKIPSFAKSKKIDATRLKDTHFMNNRSNPIDRSKRDCTYPWDVSDLNIRHDYREREDFDYRDRTAPRFDVINEKNGMVGKYAQRDLPRESRNTLENRLKCGNNEFMYKFELPSVEEMMNIETEIATQEMKMEDDQPENDIEEPMKQEIAEKIIGTVPHPQNIKRRKYMHHMEDIPIAIQQFCDTTWPMEMVTTNVEGKKIELEFTGEFALRPEELADIPLLREPYLKDNYILIADGTGVLVASLKDHAGDFDVWLASDCDIQGNPYPFNTKMKISKFIEIMQINK